MKVVACKCLVVDLSDEKILATFFNEKQEAQSPWDFFTSMWRMKSSSNIQQFAFTKYPILTKKHLEGDLVGRIQADSFEKLRI